jgi:hypothetical protein
MAGGRTKRKSIALSGSDPEYTPEEIEWILAVEKFRKRERVYYPSSVDLLRLARSMGYRKVETATPEYKRNE